MDCLTLKRHNILIKTQNRVLSMLVKQHCTLERGTRKGDAISAYLFIMALEVVFFL